MYRIEEMARAICYRSRFCAYTVNLPDLTKHLSSFSDDVNYIVRETKALVGIIKEDNDVRRMSCVRHALSEIKYFIDKAHEYIGKINDIPYYFQCEFSGESTWTDYQRCKTRFEKGMKILQECLVIYETLKSYCKDAQRSCDAAAEELYDKAESARKKKIAARATGAVLTGAGVGTGVALSVVAGVFTFGIGTVVGLATTGAVAAAAGVGSGVAGAVVGEYFNRSADNFRQMSKNFLRLSDHAIALAGLSEEMMTTLGNINYHLEYEEAGILISEVKRNGKSAYAITSYKLKEVTESKNALATAINSAV